MKSNTEPKDVIGRVQRFLSRAYSRAALPYLIAGLLLLVPSLLRAGKLSTIFEQLSKTARKALMAAVAETESGKQTIAKPT